MRLSGLVRCLRGRCCIWGICLRNCRTFACSRGLLRRRMGRTGGGEIVSIAKMKKHAILETIRQLKGDKLMAAKLLGIGKTTLYRKLKEYGIAEGPGD